MIRKAPKSIVKMSDVTADVTVAGAYSDAENASAGIGALAGAAVGVAYAVYKGFKVKDRMLLVFGGAGGILGGIAGVALFSLFTIGVSQE